jgi:hypothetical protein
VSVESIILRWVSDLNRGFSIDPPPSVPSDKDELMTTDEAAAPSTKRRRPPKRKTASSSSVGKVKAVEGPRTFLTDASVIVKNLILEEEEKAAAREKKMEGSNRKLKVSGVLLSLPFDCVLRCVGLAQCRPRPVP